MTSNKAKVFTGKQALRVDGSAQLLNAGLHRLGIATTQGWTYEGCELLPAPLYIFLSARSSFSPLRETSRTS